MPFSSVPDSLSVLLTLSILPSFLSAVAVGRVRPSDRQRSLTVDSCDMDAPAAFDSDFGPVDRSFMLRNSSDPSHFGTDEAFEWLCFSRRA